MSCPVCGARDYFESGNANTCTLCNHTWVVREPLRLLKTKDQCGPGNWTTGGEDVFLESCIGHDNAYVESEEGKRHSQKTADKEFLNRMLLQAGDSTYLKIRAWAYYSAVRTFGWFWWGKDTALTRFKNKIKLWE